MTIDLSRTEPRWYQRATEAALCQAGRRDLAEMLHLARPRDLAEMQAALPEDIHLDPWGVARTEER